MPGAVAIRSGGDWRFWMVVVAVFLGILVGRSTGCPWVASGLGLLIGAVFGAGGPGT